MLPIPLLLFVDSGPHAKDLTFNFGSVRYEATLEPVGDCGLVWIRSNTPGKGRDVVQIVDDPYFEGLSLRSFPLKGRPDARVIFAEYYRSNWNVALFFLVQPEEITEVLGFSHRDPDSLRIFQDKAGNLVEVRFSDRWIGSGARPLKLRGDPARGKRWALVSSFKASNRHVWTPYRSSWKAVPRQ